MVMKEEKMDLIVKRFDLPDTTSNSFFEGALKVRQRMNRKKIRRYILLIILLSLIGYGIAVFLCKGITLEGCRAEKNS